MPGRSGGRLRDRWLPRIVAVEISFVVVFSLWYLGRYYHVVPKFNFMTYAAFLLAFGIVIIVGDVLYDALQAIALLSLQWINSMFMNL